LHNNNYETSTKQKSEILMEIYTVAIYDRRMCMKKIIPVGIVFQGRQLVVWLGVSFCNLTHSSSLYVYTVYRDVMSTLNGGTHRCRKRTNIPAILTMQT